MDTVNTLRDYGLFDAKVPRYTSFPPANRFRPNVGARNQRAWLSALPPDEPVSLYIHIPFCRRLCWFCACRTQGTSSLRPVEAYLEDLITEIAAVARTAPEGLRMGRLHLGGGTPTLLAAAQMERLLDAVEHAFAPAPDYEFSVEIDPTEAELPVLRCLAQRGMRRASIGVQDFDPKVQQAIGRAQSFALTQKVVHQLRALGVRSLNIDLLYGLPHQTQRALVDTLNLVLALRPDRLALYGYAHVPHMSKRQVMIPDAALPSPETRYGDAALAKSLLETAGYVAIGIDHFARPEDSMARAAQRGRLRRNFQGYTDDPCPTLIGLGASAISRLPQGYLQNAVATRAYCQRVQSSGLAAHKGYTLTAEDRMVADLVEAILCDGTVETDQISVRHPGQAGAVTVLLYALSRAYPKAVAKVPGGIALRPGMGAFARVAAAHLDRALHEHHIHSTAI